MGRAGGIRRCDRGFADDRPGSCPDAYWRKEPLAKFRVAGSQDDRGQMPGIQGESEYILTGWWMFPHDEGVCQELPHKLRPDPATASRDEHTFDLDAYAMNSLLE